MTMPHLHNCPHSGDGWCLECVKILRDDKERLMQKLLGTGLVSSSEISPGDGIAYRVQWTPQECTLNVEDVVYMVETPDKVYNLFLRIADFSLHRITQDGTYVMVRKAD